jgi:hypothetical protein
MARPQHPPGTTFTMEAPTDSILGHVGGAQVDLGNSFNLTAPSPWGNDLVRDRERDSAMFSMGRPPLCDKVTSSWTWFMILVTRGAEGGVWSVYLLVVKNERWWRSGWFSSCRRVLPDDLFTFYGDFVRTVRTNRSMYSMYKKDESEGTRQFSPVPLWTVASAWFAVSQICSDCGQRTKPHTQIIRSSTHT